MLISQRMNIPYIMSEKMFSSQSKMKDKIKACNFGPSGSVQSVYVTSLCYGGIDRL